MAKRGIKLSAILGFASVKMVIALRSMADEIKQAHSAHVVYRFSFVF